MMSFEDSPKGLKDDRILVLQPIDGKKAKSSTGLVDPRLFSGENKLHAIRTPNNLWYFRYDSGGLPEPLKAKFTTFEEALRHAKLYMKGRNIDVVEVVD